MTKSIGVGRGGKRPGAGRPRGSRNKSAPRRDFERAWIQAALSGNLREVDRLDAAERARLEAEVERIAQEG